MSNNSFQGNYNELVRDYEKYLLDKNFDLNKLKKDPFNVRIITQWGIGDYDPNNIKRRDSEQSDIFDHRTPFQHDIARIIHSKAFRRLKHKTQVFISYEEDHNRTRLTHSLEVMQIATSVARTLGLNDDLVGAIALGHDLGHTPFGHAGEMVLDELSNSNLKKPFKHNIQSLRVVEELADDCTEESKTQKGLNLTNAVVEGILKHTTYKKYIEKTLKYKVKHNEYNRFLDLTGIPSYEAQLVNICDEIAQRCHDLDDWLRSNQSNLLIWKKIKDILTSNLKNAYEFYKKIESNKRAELFACRINEFEGRVSNCCNINEVKRNPNIIKGLIDLFVLDLIIYSTDTILPSNKEICFSEHFKMMEKQLKDCQYKYIYNCSAAQERNERARYFILNMHAAYERNPLLLADKTLEKYFRSINEGDVRVYELRSNCDNATKAIKKLKKRKEFQLLLIDYIAGMTDSYVQEQYSKIFTPINYK